MTKLELMEDLQIDEEKDLLLLLRKIKYWHNVATELHDRLVVQVFLEPVVEVKHD